MKIITNEKQKVYFFSDPHYDHAIIVEGTSPWEDKSQCRPFKTLHEHNKTLIDNINKTVREDDVLFCLGDWSFGNYRTGDNIENVRKFRESINCKNVHLIYGNHDQEIRKNKLTKMGVPLQTYFSSVNDYLELTIVEVFNEQNIRAKKQQIILSHYAFRVWNHSARGSWMLFGHSHGNLNVSIANPEWQGDDYYIRNFRTMDVGIDTNKEFRPYSYEELKEIMGKRNVELTVDHHGR